MPCSIAEWVVPVGQCEGVVSPEDLVVGVALVRRCRAEPWPGVVVPVLPPDEVECLAVVAPVQLWGVMY